MTTGLLLTLLRGYSSSGSRKPKTWQVASLALELTEEGGVGGAAGDYEKGEAFERADGVAFEDVEADVGAVEDGKDGGVDGVVLGSADLVEDGIALPAEVGLEEADKG